MPPQRAPISSSNRASLVTSRCCANWICLTHVSINIIISYCQNELSWWYKCFVSCAFRPPATNHDRRSPKKGLDPSHVEMSLGMSVMVSPMSGLIPLLLHNSPLLATSLWDLLNTQLWQLFAINHCRRFWPGLASHTSLPENNNLGVSFFLGFLWHCRMLNPWGDGVEEFL